MTQLTEDEQKKLIHNLEDIIERQADRLRELETELLVARKVVDAARGFMWTNINKAVRDYDRIVSALLEERKAA